MFSLPPWFSGESSKYQYWYLYIVHANNFRLLRRKLFPRHCFTNFSKSTSASDILREAFYHHYLLTQSKSMDILFCVVQKVPKPFKGVPKVASPQSALGLPMSSNW